jgi:hypothetical protein
LGAAVRSLWQEEDMEEIQESEDEGNDLESTSCGQGRREEPAAGIANGGYVYRCHNLSCIEAYRTLTLEVRD